MGELLPRTALEQYLSRSFGQPVGVRSIVPLGEDAGEKGFGYGVPLRVSLEGGPVEEIVVHTVGSKAFGHDTLADRAAAAVLAHETFNNLPGHVRALDVGAVQADDTCVSLRAARDFFVITQYGEGDPYFLDLEQLASGHPATEADLGRVDRLAAYLARIHSDRQAAPALYVRRVRELMGHHECILGLLDSYDQFPLDGFTSKAELRELERRCVDWRHRLKRFPHRLCRVHGDFHPWNVLWRSDGQLTLLDRSRGEWGEAADDVSCMAINFLFFSLQAHGRFHQPFRGLWDRFFETYMAATRDDEMMQVIPPYFVWRALVLASPVWYPALDDQVRRTLFGFIDRLLALEEFDWRHVDTLLEPRDGVSREGER
jgi:Ser/Thr protein kinase RdoA (MazF antagonist)